MNKRTINTILRSNQGFTLLEVLIAITLLSFIMLGIFNFTDNLIGTAQRVSAEDKDLLQIETAMARIEWDFSQIYSPLYFSHAMEPDKMTPTEGEAYNQMIAHYQANNRFTTLSYDGLPIPVFQFTDKTTFSFFTTSNRRRFQDQKQSNFAWVQYSLETDDSEDKADIEEEPKSKLVLVRKFLSSQIYKSEDIQWEDIKSQILLRNISSVKYEFWNLDSEKWVENLDTIKNGHQKIDAIKLTIEYFNLDGNELTSVRVFRPLYPHFVPEDMYSYLNAKATTPSTNSNNSNSNNTEEE